jgi:membrane protease subunit HflC
MKTALIVVIGIVVLLGVLVVGGVFYIVNETEQVVITQFGEPKGDPVTTPGLKVKLPFIQKANYFDKRFLEWDGDPNEVPTRDKRFIHVDTYSRWRITDPLKYFQRLRSEQGAQSRLDDILDGETRNVIANHDLIEVVRSSNRAFEISEEIAGEATPGAGVTREATPEAGVTIEATPESGVTTIRSGRARLEEEVLLAAQTRTEDLGIEILDFLRRAAAKRPGSRVRRSASSNRSPRRPIVSLKRSKAGPMPRPRTSMRRPTPAIRSSTAS